MNLQKVVVLLILSTSSAVIAQPLDDAARKKAMLDRAQAAELPGNWVPAPIAAASHFAAAYAQRLCSAILMAKMDPAMAHATLGDSNALASVAQRIKMREPVVDQKRRDVRVQNSEGTIRVARRLDSQGCVILPETGGSVGFTPTQITPHLPPGRWANACPIRNLRAMTQRKSRPR